MLMGLLFRTYMVYYFLNQQLSIINSLLFTPPVFDNIWKGEGVGGYYAKIHILTSAYDIYWGSLVRKYKFAGRQIYALVVKG